MSPEQARGKVVDRRTDVWSFGCVLFEMLSGRRPFAAADTVSDAIAAILTGEVGWAALPSQTPASVRRLLERCLRKDVRRGCPTSLKARIHSKRARRESGARTPARSTRCPLASGRPRRTCRAGVGRRRGRVGAAGAPGGTDHDPIRDPGASRFEAARKPATHDGDWRPDLNGWPHGGVRGRGGRTDDDLGAPARCLDGASAPSTQGAGRPFWSPDSRSLAFFAGSQLKRIALAEGSRTVFDEPGRDVAWSADGVMLIGGGNRPLRRLPASGGVPTPVTALAPGELTHDYPQFLPDGQHFVYFGRGPTVEDWDVFVGSLDSKERQRLDGIHGAVKVPRQRTPDVHPGGDPVGAALQSQAPGPRR